MGRVPQAESDYCVNMIFPFLFLFRSNAATFLSKTLPLLRVVEKDRSGVVTIAAALETAMRVPSGWRLFSTHCNLPYFPRKIAA